MKVARYLQRVERRLLIVEPGLTQHPSATIAVGIGHWREALERFAGAWDGPVDLIGNPPDPRVVGIRSFRRFDEFVGDPTKPLNLRFLSRIARVLDRLFAGPINATILRSEWESNSSVASASTLVDEIRRNPNTTIFLPTATPMMVETIVRLAETLDSVSAGKTNVIARFACHHFERVDLRPDSFALQLRRWVQRARPLRLAICAEIKKTAEDYAAVSGVPVYWGPWPVGPAELQPQAPQSIGGAKILIYAVRREQGGRSLGRIVRAITGELPGCGITVLTSMRELSSTPRFERSILATIPSIQVDTAKHSPRDLHRIIAAHDVAVLPYDRKRYARRFSAFMWSALDEGVPLVAPAGTGFGDEIAQHDLGRSYQQLREIPTLVSQCLADCMRHRMAIDRYQLRRSAAIAELFSEIRQGADSESDERPRD